MINISDIIEIFILAGVILLPLGMMLGRRLPDWKRAFAARFLAPRYLTPITAKSLTAHRLRTPEHRGAATPVDAAKKQSNRSL